MKGERGQRGNWLQRAPTLPPHPSVWKTFRLSVHLAVYKNADFCFAFLTDTHMLPTVLTSHPRRRSWPGAWPCAISVLLGTHRFLSGAAEASPWATRTCRLSQHSDAAAPPEARTLHRGAWAQDATEQRQDRHPRAGAQSPDQESGAKGTAEAEEPKGHLQRKGQCDGRWRQEQEFKGGGAQELKGRTRTGVTDGNRVSASLTLQCQAPSPTASAR